MMVSSPNATSDGQDTFLRTAFRRAGRCVLCSPDSRPAHEARVSVALSFPGSEPVQAALVDMLHGCEAAPAEFTALLESPEISTRLAPHVLAELRQAAHSGKKIDIVSELATRWCVLVTPAMDIPRRALLCSVDDSRTIAAEAEAAILAGNHEAEVAFLEHCEGTHDTLAFMLVRRALRQHGIEMGARWKQVSIALQGGVK